jgi:hypothetical protein
MLLPQGLISSPYEVLDYQSTLTLHDAAGTQATFHRVQRVWFLQEGVSAILDHAWGAGVLLTHYFNSAGTLADAFRDGPRRHLVIELKRPMARGETLAFDVQRTVIAGFTQDAESLETTIDHPVRRVGATVVFPMTRPCLAATLESEDEITPLPVRRRHDQRTQISIDVMQPRPHTPYTIRWRW